MMDRARLRVRSALNKPQTDSTLKERETRQRKDSFENKGVSFWIYFALRDLRNERHGVSLVVIKLFCRCTAVFWISDLWLGLGSALAVNTGTSIVKEPWEVCDQLQHKSTTACYGETWSQWKLQKRNLRCILAGMKSWKYFKNHTNGVCTLFHSGHQTGPLLPLKGSTYKFSNLRPRGLVSWYQCENISNFDILACRNFRTSL